MTWPDAVFASPLLRGLDERGRAEVTAAGSLLDLADGDAVYRAGEPADAFYVVARGAAVVSGTRRGEGSPRDLRRAERGECFGEEAVILGGGERALDARAVARSTIARVPLVVFRRSVERAGGQALVERLERAMKRAGARDLFATMSFARLVPAGDLEPLLDAIEHRHLERGEALYRAGDPADAIYFVVDGMLQIQSADEDRRVTVEAYVSRGDVVGDEALAGAEVRAVSAVAVAASWVSAIDVDVARRVLGRHAGVLEQIRRVSTEGAELQRSLARRAGTTAHVLHDLYRLRAARSLLVIDQSACVRCGHCTTSCASAHDDGTSRLVRRGDRLVTTLGDRDRVNLLVPASCQHCKNPACLMDCPTGAIGRDARGEVFVREELCTGCGSCAKGCPWDNIQMAPRPSARGGASDLPGKSSEVAVKCDLCKGVTGGPACVSACPTQAIRRIDPERDLPELAELAGRARPASVVAPASPVWPAAIGAALAAAGVARLPIGRWSSGILVLVAIVGLVAYAARKRAPARLAGRAGPTRVHYMGHVALGVLAAGLAWAHGGAGPAPLASSMLRYGFAGALLSGALAAAIYALAPRRLAGLEKRGLLPEDVAARRRELDDRVFSILTGKSELTKTIYKKVLAPYAKSAVGALGLLLSGRSLSAEEARVRARIEAMLSGRGAGKLGGLDELVRVVVELRGLRAQAPLSWLCSAALPVHLALTLSALALVALHVALVWGRP